MTYPEYRAARLVDAAAGIDRPPTQWRLIVNARCLNDRAMRRRFERRQEALVDAEPSQRLVRAVRDGHTMPRQCWVRWR